MEGESMNYKEQIEETMKKFHNVKPDKMHFGKIEGKDYIQTQRQFTVTLYEENTEYEGCLSLLAQIAQWFQVSPKIN